MSHYPTSWNHQGPGGCQGTGLEVDCDFCRHGWMIDRYMYSVIPTELLLVGHFGRLKSRYCTVMTCYVTVWIYNLFLQIGFQSTSCESPRHLVRTIVTPFGWGGKVIPIVVSGWMLYCASGVSTVLTVSTWVGIQAE